MNTTTSISTTSEHEVFQQWWKSERGDRVPTDNEWQAFLGGLRCRSVLPAQSAAEPVAHWMRVDGDRLLISRCNWIYPHSTPDVSGERDERRYASIGRRDGCIVLSFGGAYVDAQDVATMLAATPAQQPAQARPSLLAADHTGMRVDYSGLLKQARAGLRSSPGLAEMLRQLQEHLEELGQRWYAGDTAVVDEILQLYCIEREARAAVKAKVST